MTCSQLIKGLLIGLDGRYRQIIELRYGLTKPEAATLAAIGENYGVTRERIRQLEVLAVKFIKQNLNKGDYPDFIKLVINHLKRLGGVRREAELINDIRMLLGIGEKVSAVFANQVRFLLEISDQIARHTEDKDLYSFWYLTKEDKKRATDFIAKLIKVLKNNEPAENYLQEFVSVNFASISKKFAVNAYGDFGLAEQSEIVPKNARDWAYLVLQKTQKPMHFMDIAKVVNSLRNKNFNPQTIHNELIKDEDFVLVGKGIYALREHGYEPGTAREVIAKLIKKHGPLTSQKVIELVSQERFFKTNTILINLQNRSYFRRLDDGRYSVKEA